VQASRHEAFGLSLAEGMLCGAIPVVTDAGALPEVVGDAGVVIASQDPHAIADGIRQALDLGADGSRQARERVQAHFTIEQRRALVHGLIECPTRGAAGTTWRRTMPLTQALLQSLFRLMCVVGRPIGGIHPRRLYCWVARHAFPRPEFRWYRNRWGSELWLSPYYYLDRNIIALGSYDSALHNFIERHVKPGSVCMDVGANLGEVTLHLATRVGSEGKVYAFEPVAGVHDRLSRHVERNGAGEVVETFRMALSNRTGAGTIHHADSLADNQGIGSLVTVNVDLTNTQEVALVTLDEFVERRGIRRLDFMKIDIQGAEPLLLEGGRKTFATLSPDLLIEVAPRELQSAGRDSRDLCVMLEELGYRLYRLNGHGIGTRIDALTVSPKFEANNVLCVKQPTGGRAGGDLASVDDARAPHGRSSTRSTRWNFGRPGSAPTPHAVPRGEPAGRER
jgi:FkbM family methyltransferase